MTYCVTLALCRWRGTANHNNKLLVETCQENGISVKNLASCKHLKRDLAVNMQYSSDSELLDILNLAQKHSNIQINDADKRVRSIVEANGPPLTKCDIASQVSRVRKDIESRYVGIWAAVSSKSASPQVQETRQKRIFSARDIVLKDLVDRFEKPWLDYINRMIMFKADIEARARAAVNPPSAPPLSGGGGTVYKPCTINRSVSGAPSDNIKYARAEVPKATTAGVPYHYPYYYYHPPPVQVVYVKAPSMFDQIMNAFK